MKILYPFNPLNTKMADEPYLEEFELARSVGLQCSLFDFDALSFDEFSPKPNFASGDRVLYRGWMLNPFDYNQLVCKIADIGAVPFVGADDYKKCHHIVGWYDACADFTAESHFFFNDEHLEANIAKLEWDSYFIKDFVKSNSHEKGSIAHSPAEAIEIVDLIAQFRGAIEGGVAVRKVEKYLPETEQRFFVLNQQVYAASENVPDLIYELAKLNLSFFYSIDIVQTTEGKYRLVEIGDGQVSDKKSWPVERFVQMLATVKDI